MQKINPVLMVAVIAAIADLATTAAIFALGGHELNPFIEHVSLPEMAILHIVVLVVAYTVNQLIERNLVIPEYLRDLSFIIVAVFFFAAVIWNIHELWSYAVALAYTVVF